MIARPLFALLAPLALLGCGAHPNPDAERAMLDARVSELRAVIDRGPPAPDQRPQVLILGVFHFAGSSDLHKPKYNFEVFTEQGQRELGEVLDRLARFNPTKIGIERNSDKQAGVDSWFTGYKAGNFARDPNEILTIGFALAQRLGHERVFAIDADGTWLPTAPEDAEAFKRTEKSLGLEGKSDSPVDARYMEMFEKADQIRSRLTLRQQLLLINHPGYVQLGHGTYLVGTFEVNTESNFVGADSFASMWQHRNLRIFANIQRLASKPDDRVLILIGAGHLPYLHFHADHSPLVRRVSAEEVLGSSAPTPQRDK